MEASIITESGHYSNDMKDMKSERFYYQNQVLHLTIHNISDI